VVQFQSIYFFHGFLQFLLGFSKVTVFCVTLYLSKRRKNRKNYKHKKINVEVGHVLSGTQYINM